MEHVQAEGTGGTAGDEAVPSPVGPVIVFDGKCVLCSANAQFVLKHDKAGRFRLAAMQSPAGAALFRRFGVDPDDPETLIVVQGDRALRDSDAALAVWSGLEAPWRWLAILRFVPHPIRDATYRWIARNRYRLFGRRETCWVPNGRQAERIL